MTESIKAAASDKVWSPEIRRAENIGDRGLRKWIAEGRFPRPDGNFSGRNFWLRSTYEQWKTEVLAGRYARHRRPGVSASAAA